MCRFDTNFPGKTQCFQFFVNWRRFGAVDNICFARRGGALYLRSMTRTGAGDFRRRQAVADLRHVAKAAPGDAIRGIAADLMSDLAALVSGRPDPDAAGWAWSTQAERTLGLPEPARGAALAAFRHLYERQKSMDPPGEELLPVIPPAP